LREYTLFQLSFLKFAEKLLHITSSGMSWWKRLAKARSVKFGKQSTINRMRWLLSKKSIWVKKWWHRSQYF